MRPDGTYNTPPKATMISPIYIPVDIQQTISIPTIDFPHTLTLKTTVALTTESPT